MKRQMLALFVGLSVVSVSGLVLAQRTPGGDVQYKKQTKYDFDDDVVEGDLVRPDGEFVDSRKSAKHSSLIKIRENFVPEMLKSAEDI